MSEQETRDMAVKAITLIEAHMMDCTKFRENLLKDTADFRKDLSRIERRIAMVLGGLIVLSHGFDWFMKFMGHGA